MRTFETLTLHLDLSGHPQDAEFTLLAGAGVKHRLTAYADVPGRREEHAAANRALALLPDEHLRRITHFVEDAEIAADHPTMRRVVYPSRDEHSLPEIALAFIHVPTADYAQYLRMHPVNAGHVPYQLARYGVDATALAEEELDVVRLDAARVASPHDTAVSLVFHHVEIGSVNPHVAAAVRERFIPQAPGFGDLVTYLETHANGARTKWYRKSYATWQVNGKDEPCPANPDLKNYVQDKKDPDWPVVNGQRLIPQYELTDESSSDDGGVLGAASRAIQNALIATKNADQFRGHLWTSQPGTTQRAQTDVPPAPHPAAALPAAVQQAAGFAIKNTTPYCSLWIYDQQLTYFASTKTLSFPIKNWPSRYLMMYVEFVDSTGAPIKRADIPGWPDFKQWYLPDWIQSSDTKNYLDWIGAGNTVFGFPVPPLTQQVEVSFPWPDAATKARVLLGGLGAAQGFRDFDPDVCTGGVIGTSIACLGWDALWIPFSVYVVGPWMASWDDATKQMFAYVAQVVGLAATILGAADFGSSWGKMILAKVGNQVASIIFGLVVEKIAVAAAKAVLVRTIGASVAQMTSEEIADEAPVVGWAIRIAAVAASVNDFAFTTVVCACSPSVFDLEIDRTMNLTVTVAPDPAHQANWPRVADHWTVQVAYPKSASGSGGTTLTKSGPMPGASDQPLMIPFPGIPAGGQIDIVAGVYSEDGWLAGQWKSGRIGAVPDQNANLAVGGNITERLVPLTPTTTYGQVQRLSYSDTAQHHWQATRFAIDASLAATLDKATVSADLQSAFAANGNVLGATAAVSVATAGSSWKLTDSGAGDTYQLDKVQIQGTPDYEIHVQDTSHSAPLLPATPQDCQPDGHRLCRLQNLSYNNERYMLGYAWRASGQNMPRDNNPALYDGQMYAFQAISALGRPQDRMLEPARGFTNPSFLAFDQFGISPLYVITDKPAGTVAATAKQLDAGTMPTDLATKSGTQIPQGAKVDVVIAGSRWTVGAAGQDPLLDLRHEQGVLETNGASAMQTYIGVYSWPVPRQDNFYLDPRSYSDTNKLYFIHGVSLDAATTGFDYDTDAVWGQFDGVVIGDLAVHPHGYVVGIDYDDHKLLTLKLAEEPVPAAKAPIAMPLSGFGQREGLLDKPVALAISADGRILILEAGNQRIQAFDVLGNPVPCFSVGQSSFALDAKLLPGLDARDGGTALVQAFQHNVEAGSAPLFVARDNTAPASTTALDAGTVDMALGAAFLAAGLGDGGAAPPLTVTVTTVGTAWLLTDTKTTATYDVRYEAGADHVKHLCVFRAFGFTIDVTSPGTRWLLTDTVHGMTFEVANTSTDPNAPTLVAKRLVATMPLHKSGGGDVTYLDVAAETTGYIYVLSSDGAKTYMLDVYMPDGSHLFHQQAVYAGKLAVDQWRSMFTLNYETLLGPGQRTEPGLSVWVPSTPASSG